MHFQDRIWYAWVSHACRELKFKSEQNIVPLSLIIEPVLFLRHIIFAFYYTRVRPQCDFSILGRNAWNTVSKSHLMCMSFICMLPEKLLGCGFSTPVPVWVWFVPLNQNSCPFPIDTTYTMETSTHRPLDAGSLPQYPSVVVTSKSEPMSIPDLHHMHASQDRYVLVSIGKNPARIGLFSKE